jgi:hypothetical protein
MHYVELRSTNKMTGTSPTIKPSLVFEAFLHHNLPMHAVHHERLQGDRTIENLSKTGDFQTSLL